VLGYQAREVATGGVAMQDLQDEQMHGSDRIEQARTPWIAPLVAQGENCGSIEQGG
jgi:hypothetical protein